MNNVSCSHSATPSNSYMQRRIVWKKFYKSPDERRANELWRSRLFRVAKTMKLSFCHSSARSLSLFASFFLPHFLGQGRHPTTYCDILARVLFVWKCVPSGSLVLFMFLQLCMSSLCVREVGKGRGTHSVSCHLSQSTWDSVSYYLPILQRQAYHGALYWGLAQSSAMGLIRRLHAEAHV